MTQTGSIPDRIGPFRVLRALGSDRGPERFLCFEEGGSHDVVLYVAGGSVEDAEAREKKASAYLLLSHASITRLERFFVHEGRFVAVTEYDRGLTLEELILARASGKPLGDRACQLVALGICEALAHAHAGALAHGGLQPVDVTITSAGAVKVGGFGFSRFLEPVAAPADPRADLVACGRMLYMLFAMLPEEPREWLPLGRVRSALPDALTAAIDRAADPSSRSAPRCDEIAAILREHLDAGAARGELVEAVRAALASQPRANKRGATLLGVAPSPFAHELPTIPKGRHVTAEAEETVKRAPVPAEPATEPAEPATEPAEPAPAEKAAKPEGAAAPEPAPAEPATEPAVAAPATIERAPAASEIEFASQVRGKSKAGRIALVIGLAVVLAIGSFYTRKIWRARHAARPTPAPLPVASAALPPAALSSAAEPSASPAPSAAPAASAAPRLASSAGYLTVHTPIPSANVYVGPTKVGRVETQLTVACGKRFVAVGLPTRKERPPVWLAPGKTVDIACGGSTEITVQARKVK